MKKVFAFLAAFIVAFCVFSADYTPVTAEAGAQSVQTTATTNAVDATEFTPAFVGQLLVGTVSNDVYVAIATTTNSWVQISN